MLAGKVAWANQTMRINVYKMEVESVLLFDTLQVNWQYYLHLLCKDIVYAIFPLIY